MVMIVMMMMMMVMIVVFVMLSLMIKMMTSGDEEHDADGDSVVIEGVVFIDDAMIRVCEVGTVGKISDCQTEGPRFNPRPGRGSNFGRPSFATPSVDRDVKPLV